MKKAETTFLPRDQQSSCVGWVMNKRLCVIDTVSSLSVADNYLAQTSEENQWRSSVFM